jgi:hypothetical protein
MTRMDCPQLAEAAPELALGILPGDERAAALAHLDDCPGCQQHVSSLAGLTDELLLLAPRAEPPAGFERRVLASLGNRPTDVRSLAAKRRRTRASVAALALAACIAVALLVRWNGTSAPPTLAAAPMRTDSGAVVGQVFVHRQRPAVLFMSLPGWADQVTSYGHPGDTYGLRIERRDAPARVVPVAMGADASWATTLDFDANSITSVAMVDSQGRVWCRAQLGPLDGGSA